MWQRSLEGDRHRPVLVELGCWIGADVTIYPGVVIREGCVINAGAVVTASTEPNGLYVPAAASRTKMLEIDQPDDWPDGDELFAELEEQSLRIPQEG